jgi:hypothetical protein
LCVGGAGCTTTGQQANHHDDHDRESAVDSY